MTLPRDGGAPSAPPPAQMELRNQTLADVDAPIARVIVAIALVEIALSAVLLWSDAGFPRWRVLAIVVASLAAVAVTAVELTLAAKLRDGLVAALAPALVNGLLGAVVVVSGGAASPVSALLFHATVGLAARGRSTRLTAAVAVVVLVVLVTVLLPAAWRAPEVASPQREVVWAVVLLGVTFTLAIQLSLFHGAQQRALRQLDALREDVLGDNEMRVRGLESIGARVAHEIKNPLTSIKGLLSLEREEVHDEAGRRRLEVIDGEVTRIQRIVQDYLSYARPLDALRVRRMDLGALVRHTIEVLEGRSRQAGVTLVASGDRASVEADPHRLRGVLLNLLSNAIEATGQGGTVGVEVSGAGERVIIKVRDTGKGMSAHQLERLGTPFFTTRARGTGLGVVVSRSTVEQHGGTLTYQSESGVGTTVTVDLPVVSRLEHDPTASYDELVHPDLAQLRGGPRQPPRD
jgi:two-component system, NtrC family, sensor histidine kinase HydH